MRVRSLGADGPTVPPVGVGDVSLARSALRGVEASEVSRALHEAIELGIDLVDVSHEREAIQLVGETIRVLRARDRVVAAFRLASASNLREQVDATLRESKLEVLTVVQIPLTGMSPENRGYARHVDALAGHEDMAKQLVRAGKVLHWSVWGDGDCDPAAPFPTGDWLLATNVAFNLCERTVPGGCILARRPLAGGALAGELAPGRKLLRGDDRVNLPLEKLAVGATKLAAFTKREPPAARSCAAAREQLEKNERPEFIECTTVAELALRWVIDRGAIALPRLHRREHVAEAVAAAAAPPLSIQIPELDI
jgi:diketogulonate reductase-like aldo/keto reductase